MSEEVSMCTKCNIWCNVGRQIDIVLISQESFETQTLTLLLEISISFKIKEEWAYSWTYITKCAVEFVQ